MKKHLVLTTAILIGATQIACIGANIYSSQKLNDGTTINMCRLANGKIDYCTLDDAKKALDVLHNPRKYMSEKDKIKFDKNAAYEKIAKTEFPVLDKILTLETDSKSKLNNLKYKQSLGVTINEKEISLLEFKIDVLYYLIHGTVLDEKQYINGVLDLNIQYADLLKAKDANQITQAEFDDAKSKFKIGIDKLENYYNKIATISTTDDKTTNEWLIDNYPGNKPLKKLKENAINQFFNQITPAPSVNIPTFNRFF